MLVGKEIKRLRREQGMTIKELAARTGLSVGFISNVEHEVNSPTISSLQRICQALETDMAAFFRSTAERSIVARLRDCQHLEFPAPNLAACDLFPLMNRKLQPSRITLPPGGFYGEPPLCHEGEEVCLVVSGRVQVTAGEMVYTLEAGDCVYIESNTPHQLRNLGEKKAETIWVTLHQQ